MKNLQLRTEENIFFCTVTGCWLWTGSLTSSGYGPHRRVFTRLVGPIPDGFELDHSCQTRCCINPAHLKVVTLKENRALVAIRRTHCVQGHVFDLNNTRVRANGKRDCRLCARYLERRRRRAKRHSDA